VMFALAHDIGERIAAEAALRAALLENQGLLGELQHRAKNSFAMISSMIGLAGPGRGPETIAALEELRARVASVAELYALLYSSGSYAELRLDDYCRRVAAPLVGLSGAVALDADMEGITVSAKDAAPIGLILTELVTNALKYAFPGGRRGRIAISLKRTASGALLEVRDDGVGLPPGFDPYQGQGLQLIRGLSLQIDGEFEMESDPTGTRCSVAWTLSPPA
jgi:two-component sensor histidine kinase